MRCFNGVWVAAALLSAGLVSAADTVPTIPTGTTRQQVIEKLGPPIGHANVGNVEILSYKNGQVRLENGRVERHTLRWNFSPQQQKRVAQPPPSAATPPAAVASTSVAASKETKSPLADVWMTQFDEAARDATRRNA